MIEDRAGPIGEEDFSSEKVKKLVYSYAIKHPITLYPMVVGTLVLFGGVLLNLAPVSVVVGVASVFVFAGGGAGTVILLSKGDKITKDYQRQKRLFLEEKSNKEIKNLKRKLTNLKENRAAQQTEALTESFNRFKEKLNSVIGEDAREYESYLGPAQSMYLAALNNLRLIVDNSLDIKVVDVEELEKRINELKTREDVKYNEEINYSQKQIDCVNQARQNTDELIEETEGAIATLFEVTRSLSSIMTTKDQVSGNVKSAMGKFKLIADRNRQIYDKVAETWRLMNETIL